MEEITRYLHTQTGYDLNHFLRWAIRDPETLNVLGCCTANPDPLDLTACTYPETVERPRHHDRHAPKRGRD
jgi:hypothetical protein